MIQDFAIAGRSIGPQQPPYIVAEMSGNHNQSIERAFALVDAAADAGVDAVKLQTYTAATMTLDRNDGEFTIDDPESLWKGHSLYKLYQQAHTPWDWHQPIMDRCREKNLACFSSPFDASAVDFLMELNAPAFKIASFELVDIPLIEKVARTGKPIIMSTGMATVAEIDEALAAARAQGNEQILLLKCTSSYPATPTHSHIRTLPHLADWSQCQVGLSDHTMGLGVATAAVALGACFIEKHFTLKRSDGGVDSAFSLEPDELKALVVESQRAWEGLGQVHYGISDAEKASTAFRRSLYVAQDIKAGDPLTSENIRAIRPGHGLAPKYLKNVMGKAAKQNLTAGTPLTWDCLL